MSSPVCWALTPHKWPGHIKGRKPAGGQQRWMSRSSSAPLAVNQHSSGSSQFSHADERKRAEKHNTSTVCLSRQPPDLVNSPSAPKWALHFQRSLILGRKQFPSYSTRQIHSALAQSPPGLFICSHSESLRRRTNKWKSRQSLICRSLFLWCSEAAQNVAIEDSKPLFPPQRDASAHFLLKPIISARLFCV